MPADDELSRCVEVQALKERQFRHQTGTVDHAPLQGRKPQRSRRSDATQSTDQPQPDTTFIHKCKVPDRGRQQVVPYLQDDLRKAIRSIEVTHQVGASYKALSRNRRFSSTPPGVRQLEQFLPTIDGQQSHAELFESIQIGDGMLPLDAVVP